MTVFSSLDVNRIGKQWKKYQIDSMNVEDLNLQNMKDEIRKNINGISLENSKEVADTIFDKIKDRGDIKIYSKEYIYAAIMKELFV